MDILHTKLQRLEQYLKEQRSAVIAFSGGVDSAFLMRAAHRVLGQQAVAVTARSCAFPERELDEARALTKAEGIRHIEFDFPAFEVEGFAKNPPDRCYYCKTAILKEMKRIAETEGLACVIEGSNADDEKDYRPGAKAICEQGVLSPLKEAGLTKSEIGNGGFPPGTSSRRPALLPALLMGNRLQKKNCLWWSRRRIICMNRDLASFVCGFMER